MATARADRWVVFGTEVRKPMKVRDARFAGAVFSCAAAEARAVVRGTGLDAVTVAGRSFSALACISYIGRRPRPLRRGRGSGPGPRPGW